MADLTGMMQAAAGVEVSNPWDISAATYVQDTPANDGLPQDVSFKPDGTKMYTVGRSGTDINEFALSTAWDISTASYTDNFLLSGQTSNPTGVSFKPDGTKMFVVAIDTDIVAEYNLGTAWDVSTATFVQSFSIATEETGAQGLFVKPDGTKMYVIGQTGDDINEYSLSSAWDVSTASYVQNFSVSSTGNAPQAIYFRADGEKFFICNFPSGVGSVIEYNVSSAWDISTATYVQAFSTASQETNPVGLFFKPDGTKMYIVGLAQDDVIEYDL